MAETMRLDPGLIEIADLPPGWLARRKFVGGEWHRQKNTRDSHGGSG